MPASATDRAEEALKRFDRLKPVKRIVVEGKRVEIEFADQQKSDDLEHVKW